MSDDERVARFERFETVGGKIERVTVTCRAQAPIGSAPSRVVCPVCLGCGVVTVWERRVARTLGVALGSAMACPGCDGDRTVIDRSVR